MPLAFDALTDQSILPHPCCAACRATHAIRASPAPCPLADALTYNSLSWHWRRLPTPGSTSDHTSDRAAKPTTLSSSSQAATSCRGEAAASRLSNRCELTDSRAMEAPSL